MKYLSFSLIFALGLGSAAFASADTASERNRLH